jgi:NAD(P)-dependent dehydrogenase (short-subunit alcohol dehydrogenase family)
MSNQPVAIVTGATSGIGRATADHLAENGYRVFGIARNPPAQAGPGISFVAADVSREAQVSQAVRQVVDAAGRIDLLVNNAGVQTLAPFEEIPIEAARAMIDTNLFGAFYLTRAVLPIMRAQRSGRLIHVSSILGLLPAPFLAVYAASKHAIEGWSESLDHETRDFGVRSVLIEPGYTRTNLVAGGRSPAAIPDYAELATRVGNAFDESVTSGDDPMLVARKVLQIARSPRPRLRYQVGTATRKRALLRRWVPESMFDSSFRKQFGLTD